MIHVRSCRELSLKLAKLSLPVLLAGFSTTALGANRITGSARNQSRGAPAAADQVVLIRTDGARQEEARTKTDTQGSFSLDVQHPEKEYLVRVIHQDVTYDQRAFSGSALAVEVFDTAPSVPGVTGTIEVLRTGADGNLLHVSDMYEITNASSPPLTQTGERAFEVYLPASAKIASVLAAGPGQAGVTISASPVPGEPGHYTVSFPLRPGATKFAFNYDLPYAGRAAFRTELAYGVQLLAVMIPPSMKFTSRSPAFQVLETGNSRYQVQSAKGLTPGAGPVFEVSGSGALPALEDQGDSAHPLSTAVPAAELLLAAVRGVASSDARVGYRLQQAQASSDTFVLAAVAALLAVASGLLIWKAQRTRLAHLAEPRGRPGR
jgi:hypothetical protein